MAVSPVAPVGYQFASTGLAILRQLYDLLLRVAAVLIRLAYILIGVGEMLRIVSAILFRLSVRLMRRVCMISQNAFLQSPDSV